MPLSLAQRRQLDANLDPAASVSMDDSKYVALDALEGCIRGRDWARYLADKIILCSNDRKACLYLTGLPGCGKSTVLRVLAKQLEKPEAEMGGALFPVLIDSEEALDLTQSLSVVEILSLILARADEAVSQQLGIEPSRFQALLDAMPALGEVLKNAKVEVDLKKGPLKLLLEFKARPTLRAQVKEVLESHLLSFFAAVSKALKELNAEVCKRDHNGLVIIMDGLEKARGLQKNWTDVLDSQEQLFKAHRPYLELPVHVLYTITPAVAPFLTGVDFLPMVKVRKRNQEDNDLGMEAMRILLRKRIPDAWMPELLGKDWETHRDALIRLSGGYPKELLRLFKEVLQNGPHPLSMDALEGIEARLVEAFREALPKDTMELLERIRREQTIQLEHESQRATLARLFDGNALMRYMNHDLWYDLHPAVARMLPAAPVSNEQ